MVLGLYYLFTGTTSKHNVLELMSSSFPYYSRYSYNCYYYIIHLVASQVCFLFWVENG